MNPAPSSPVRHCWVRTVGRGLERLLAVLGVVFLIYHVGFEFTAMTSNSMAPTLRGTSFENGDRILVEKVSHWFRPPRRWEVVFTYNEALPIMKRVVGLPGERIAIRTNQVFINECSLERPAWLQSVTYYSYGNLAAGREVDCGPGYYLLGDESFDSYDSRFTGTFSPGLLSGRAWCVVWPPSRIGWVR